MDDKQLKSKFEELRTRQLQAILENDWKEKQRCAYHLTWIKVLESHKFHRKNYSKICTEINALDKVSKEFIMSAPKVLAINDELHLALSELIASEFIKELPALDKKINGLHYLPEKFLPYPKEHLDQALANSIFVIETLIRHFGFMVSLGVYFENAQVALEYLEFVAASD